MATTPPRLGSVTTAEGWTYKFTLEDWLWAARMLSGEIISPREGWGLPQVREGETILWTMLNYFYQMRDKTFGRGPASTSPPHTYTRVIRAYSQPINPFWADKGEPAVQAHRAKITNLTPEQVDPLVLDTVTRFMQGKISGIAFAGLVHFAARSLSYADDPTHVGPQAVAGLGTKSNVFYKSNVSINWPADLLKFRFTTTTAIVAGGVTLLAIGAGIAYYYWLKARTLKATANLANTELRRAPGAGASRAKLLDRTTRRYRQASRGHHARRCRRDDSRYRKPQQPC